METNIVERPYSKEDVDKLRGGLKIEYTLAKNGASKFREMMERKESMRALGALTGGQAVQQVRAGLKAIYVSGWQVAADANQSGGTYPDQSLYPSNSVPELAKRINKALHRASQIEYTADGPTTDWMVPIVADAEAGFGGALNAYELMMWMIEAGVAAAHFEDQFSPEKKCGHLGGKVLIPTSQFIKSLIAARLATDVADTGSIIIARTDANAAKLLTNDVDERDAPFLTGERTSEGFYRVKCGIDQAIARGLAYAPYADALWCETSKPDIGEARAFAQAIHEKFPGKWLAYNCSPSFNWSANLSPEEIASFQQDLFEMGYGFQFVTLAGFHSLNHGMYNLASNYRETGMTAYSALQDAEMDSAKTGVYTAIRHQYEVGTQFFDTIRGMVSETAVSTNAMEGSTEKDQF